MIRRKKRRSRFADYYASCALAKGETRAERKKVAHAAEAAVIAATRAQVFDRDKACRACCGSRRCFLDDQMDEIVPRSKTRGLPPEERFNTRNCIRYCAWCHQDKTENRLRATPVEPARGADGDVMHEQDGKRWVS